MVYPSAHLQGPEPLRNCLGSHWPLGTGDKAIYVRTNKTLNPEMPEEDKRRTLVQQGETVYPCLPHPQPQPSRNKEIRASPVNHYCSGHSEESGPLFGGGKEVPSTSPMWSSNPGPVLDLDL